MTSVTEEMIEAGARACRKITFNALTMDECRDAVRAALEAALSASPAAQTSNLQKMQNAPVPTGDWVLVPREPTEAMLMARWPTYHPWGQNAPPPAERAAMYAEMVEKTTAIWRAMIAAAPAAPSAPQPTEPVAVKPDYWAVQSPTGSFIGLWHDKVEADRVAGFVGYTIIPLALAPYAPQPTEPVASVPLAKLIEMRDALAQGDVNEAYHVLYGLADPAFASLEPWASWEAAALVSPVAQQRDEVIEVKVMPMWKSDGTCDYFVAVSTGGERMDTPYMSSERYQAEYYAARLRWVLLGEEQPDILAFSEESHPNLSPERKDQSNG